MNALSNSFQKVPYSLRPCKQVERRIFLDGFRFLEGEGFPISSYSYVGMGSIDFVDFIMLHKFFGITKMISAEYNKKAKSRAIFNKPFKHIDVEFKPIGDVLVNLNVDVRYLAWLDYDFALNSVVAADIRSCLLRLRCESIVIATVDMEPPKSVEGTPKAWFEYFYSELQEYMDPSWSAEDFAESKLEQRVLDLLRNITSQSMTLRPNLRFELFYNFRYADGHVMLTFAGMLADDVSSRLIQNSAIARTPFYRSTWNMNPYNILVPKLTRKERLYLDSFMPAAEKWMPKAFKMDRAELEAFKEIYRYYPSYAELYIA